jgi:hypothetical protein
MVWRLLIVLGRRDPSPFSLGDIEETIETALSSLGGAESLLGRDDIS